MAVARIGGYDVETVSEVPGKFKCPFCKLIMRDPVQTSRGEMACESCYINAKGGSKLCPIDNEAMEDDDFHKDNFAKREIFRLQCYCSHKENGCPWQGTISEIEDHNVICTYKEEVCPKCHKYVIQKDLEKHIVETCEFRIAECPYCASLFDGQMMQNHQASCLQRPMECPYKCGQHISMKNLHTHVDACPKVMEGNNCPYQVVGCTFQSKNTADLEDHLHIAGNVHAALTVSMITNLKQTNVKIQQDISSEQTIRVELSKKVVAYGNDNIVMSENINKMQQELNNVQKGREEYEKTCGSDIAKVKENLVEIDMRTQQSNLHDINRTLNDIQLRFDDVERKLRSGTQGNESNAVNTSENYQNDVGKVDNLESASAVLSANIADMELKLQLLENTTYDGRQLWKIDNVAHRKHQAVCGQITALHSASCFQRKGGYKYCLRLYLNGDGMGRGTHVSLFFVVMKGEYDELLHWPFGEKVTFRLINPNNREESIVESFMPDKDSSSFKRPTKNMNIAAGCPKFVRQDNLSDYIVDDCIFIESVIGDQPHL